MKVIVKAPFFDDNGLHRRGDIVEVKMFDPMLMKEYEAKEEIKEVKATKKAKKG